MTLPNVQVGAAQEVRARAMRAIVRDVIQKLGGDTAVETFMMRTAWHEGAMLTARRQIGGGPGRSFFQFEPAKAKDGVEKANRKPEHIALLAGAGGTTTTALTTAAAALVLGQPWPPQNLIDHLLGDEATASDVFATFLCRFGLLRIPDPVPAGLDDQAEYWARNWKVKFQSPTDRLTKIAQFKANANILDALPT